MSVTVTPNKNSIIPLKPKHLHLESIRELSMDNSSIIKRNDEASVLREYATELEARIRESETTKEVIMSETLLFLSSLEKTAAEHQKSGISGAARISSMREIETVRQLKITKQRFQEFKEKVFLLSKQNPSLCLFSIAVVEKYIGCMKLNVPL